MNTLIAYSTLAVWLIAGACFAYTALRIIAALIDVRWPRIYDAIQLVLLGATLLVWGAWDLARGRRFLEVK